jgi:hypothetical protein
LILTTKQEAERLVHHFLKSFLRASREDNRAVAIELASYCWCLGIRSKRVWIDLGVHPDEAPPSAKQAPHPDYLKQRPRKPGVHWVVRADGFILDPTASVQGPHLPEVFVWERTPGV